MNEFSIFEKVSSSGYSIVVKAEARFRPATFALKVIPSPGPRGNKPTPSIRREVEILRTLDHPCIVRFFGCRFYSKTACIMMELASTNLAQLIRQSRMPEGLAKQYILQIADGLDYIHAKGIIHRDLTLNNVLVTYDGIIKISDFASALDPHLNIGHEDVWAYEDCDSRETKGPEVVLRNEQSRAGDYWSLGVILYQLVTGRDPFKSGMYYDQRKTSENIVYSPLEIPPYISPQCCEVLHRLLAKAPNSRICSFQELSSCAFFNNVALSY
ncbi:uncharacterized protein MELLADRAFT_33138 [Melampsora larici-populina 98AG31]|uniref:Protein kinase domain-containing protein n=1 Tax=Melampsora larici-populina (strain 98AG31 / pathotype 3-4-7) TaxID=747676 RepID=F4R7S1_MELLP|nr:uncharacterized protein MELLADRAFT_33138 [Melampsora larici-populina 98AG31]EGG11362.1 hypothetical protein MELLADRAFT_33138 [Melampsora larici-populina 98AG31]